MKISQTMKALVGLCAFICVVAPLHLNGQTDEDILAMPVPIVITNVDGRMIEVAPLSNGVAITSYVGGNPLPTKTNEGLDFLFYVKHQLSGGFLIKSFETIQERNSRLNKTEEEAREKQFMKERAAKIREEQLAKAAREQEIIRLATEAKEREKEKLLFEEKSRHEQMARELAKVSAENAERNLHDLGVGVLLCVAAIPTIMWVIFPFIFISKINILISEVEKIHKHQISKK